MKSTAYLVLWVDAGTTFISLRHSSCFAGSNGRKKTVSSTSKWTEGAATISNSRASKQSLQVCLSVLLAEHCKSRSRGPPKSSPPLNVENLSKKHISAYMYAYEYRLRMQSSYSNSLRLCPIRHMLLIQILPSPQRAKAYITMQKDIHA